MAIFFYVALALVAACHAGPTSEASSAAAVPQRRSAVCTSKNGYYKIDASCDSYIECHEYVATDKSCPDGLHYNPDKKWPDYPCGYPMDVRCRGRGAAQPAEPTAECPHQYGYFVSPVAAADNCGQYRLCVAGRAIEMVCPTGLAFNHETSRCDWPDLVTTCKSQDFLEFTCPAAPNDVVVNYKYDGNCYYFFSCERGHARLLSCDAGMAFDPALGRCIHANLVQCEQK